MTELRTVEDLPSWYTVLPEGVRCAICGRAWRVPGLMLNEANYEYLCGHSQDHPPMIRKVPDGSEDNPW